MLSETGQTKDKILYDSTYEIPKIDKFIDTESRIKVIRGWEWEGMGSYSLTGTEFLVGEMIKFWK